MKESQFSTANGKLNRVIKPFVARVASFATFLKNSDTTCKKIVDFLISIRQKKIAG
jgi:hypothetical protein